MVAEESVELCEKNEEERTKMCAEGEENENEEKKITIYTALGSFSSFFSCVCEAATKPICM